MKEKFLSHVSEENWGRGEKFLRIGDFTKKASRLKRRAKEVGRIGRPDRCLVQA